MSAATHPTATHPTAAQWFTWQNDAEIRHLAFCDRFLAERGVTWQDHQHAMFRGYDVQRAGGETMPLAQVHAFLTRLGGLYAGGWTPAALERATEHAARLIEGGMEIYDAERIAVDAESAARLARIRATACGNCVHFLQQRGAGSCRHYERLTDATTSAFTCPAHSFAE